ncbi:hypothetical protein CJD36_005300 [Flavipsychrobacter stenotrophus]|uniref:Uncharacterized protein n=1 Tax=Flavipsychrobacter stenotrophus TaxID=2077091 RepID=A0A2S7SWC7_9BACT|nr:hypothetical protein [Flavipsychrobacter stenotrophus]PQJ11223.1 hypothetical protein CJD36_005300 [Flavipsychrobacter stenotrophus]
MRRIALSFFIFIVYTSYGTTWPVAYPYKQRIEGQKVRVEAIAYNPYESATVPSGKTNVYYKDELLYSIDKYYRNNIYTSDDGHYFAIVYSINDVRINEFNRNDGDQINFNRRIIEIFKDGVLYKNVFLRDIIDTTDVVKNGHYFEWSYYIDINGFRDAEYGCEACNEVYGKKALKKLDTGYIDSSSYFECIRQCDSARNKETELNIAMNANYVENNTLVVLTSQRSAVRINFNTLDIQRVQFNTVVPDKEKYNPPKLIRRYNELKIPDKFYLPNLDNGMKFEDAVAALFGLKSDGEQKAIFDVFIRPTIDVAGHCVDLYVDVNDLRISEYHSDNTQNKDMTEKLYKWCKEQVFSSKKIPKGFEKYQFYGIIDLYGK